MIQLYFPLWVISYISLVSYFTGCFRFYRLPSSTYQSLYVVILLHIEYKNFIKVYHQFFFLTFLLLSYILVLHMLQSTVYIIIFI